MLPLSQRPPHVAPERPAATIALALWPYKRSNGNSSSESSKSSEREANAARHCCKYSTVQEHVWPCVRSQPFAALYLASIFFVRFLFVFVRDPNSFGRGEHGAYEQYIYVYSLVSSWCVGIKLSRFLFRMCMIIWHDNSIQWMNNSNHEIIGHLRNKMTDHKSKHFLQITFLCICNQLKSHFTFFF